jgi:hypothetical protein
MINVVGGFVVTDRMLADVQREGREEVMLMFAFIDATNIVELAYMAASLLFILGILKLGKVKTSKQGNLWAAYGMAIAIGATMLLLVTRGDWEREGEWTSEPRARSAPWCSAP